MAALGSFALRSLIPAAVGIAALIGSIPSFVLWPTPERESKRTGSDDYFGSLGGSGAAVGIGAGAMAVSLIDGALFGRQTATPFRDGSKSHWSPTATVGAGRTEFGVSGTF